MKSFFTFLSFAIFVIASAQPGTIDKTFGNRGTIIDSSVKNITELAIAVTKEGRILIGTAGPYKGLSNTFKVEAYLPNGSPDLSFGEEGSAYAVFPGKLDRSYTAGINAITLLPDGRILVAGGLEVTGNPDDLAFARFTPDGKVDSSFGTNGVASTSFGSLFEFFLSVAVQPDGKIVTAGVESIKINGGGFGDYEYQFAVARFLPDGSKDIAFGDSGLIVSPDPHQYGGARAVVIQKDGKIVAAGTSHISSAEVNFHIERYNEDGSYDKSFGVNGKVDQKINSASVSFLSDIALQEDGKLVATGRTSVTAISDPLLTTVRYNVNGSIDQSFGQGGVAVNAFNQYSEGARVFITGEKQDKIVALGSASPDGAGYDFALVGYNMDGTLDAGFGSRGTQLTDLGGTDAVTSGLIQPDGKIVEFGYVYSPETSIYYRALARFNGYPTQVPLLVRIKRWLHNHTVSWKGLPAEDKVAYYSIEQSDSRNNGFLPIAKVSSVANLRDYAISNAHLLDGMNYYRIKAVSSDGTIRYSEVAAADNIANTASVYPNPVRGNITVQGLKNNETANISIKDAAGTVLSKGVSSGSAQYSSSVGNLKPGTYYLNITTKCKTEVVPFVKE